MESERIHAGDIKLLFRSLTKSILEAENDAEISVYELFKRIEKSPLHVGQFSAHIWQWNIIFYLIPKATLEKYTKWSFPILIIKYRQKITLPKNNWIGQQLAEFFKYNAGGYVNFDGFFSYTLFDGTEVFCFVYDYIYP